MDAFNDPAVLYCECDELMIEQIPLFQAEQCGICKRAFRPLR